MRKAMSSYFACRVLQRLNCMLILFSFSEMLSKTPQIIQKKQGKTLQTMLLASTINLFQWKHLLRQGLAQLSGRICKSIKSLIVQLSTFKIVYIFVKKKSSIIRFQIKNGRSNLRRRKVGFREKLSKQSKKLF